MKKVWTVEKAENFIKRNKVQGLTFLSAVDYLNNHCGKNIKINDPQNKTGGSKQW